MMSEHVIEIVEDDEKLKEGHLDKLVVRGEQVWETIQNLLHDVTVRRVTVLRRDGKKVLDIPVYAGVAGILLLGPWTAIPLLGAIVFEYSLIVERRTGEFKQGTKPTLAKPTVVELSAGPEEQDEVEEIMLAAAPPDDLTRLNGIGPKVASLLQASGIHTYTQLAQTPISQLQAILEQAGARYRLIDPTTWPEQAAALA